MNRFTATALPTICLAWSATAVATPKTECCTAAQTRMLSDSRIGWLALHGVHPLSDAAPATLTR